MTDKKITAEQIIKALECCILGCCECCAFDDKLNFNCKDDLMKNALDLINRKQADIERLKGEIEEANEADRETELQALKESKENAKMFCEAINHAKTGAIKEFAERLKAYFEDEFIDNLVKEMTESVNYESSKKDKE